MEIQQNKLLIGQTHKSINLQLNSLIRNHDFSIKKVIRVLNKYPDRSSLFHQLDVIYHQTTQISYLLNLLMIVQHLLTSESRLSTENDEKIHWIIRKVYQIRTEIDKHNQINENTLEILNKLLKIMGNLVVFFAKLSFKNSAKLDESTLFEHQASFMINLSQQKMYNQLLNHLFDINLLLKIAENISHSQKFLQFINRTIIKHFNNIQILSSDYNEAVKEILLNTLIKCLKTIKNFDQFLNASLQRLLSIFDVKSKLRLLYQLKSTNLSIISSINCQSQYDFQFYSQIVNYCSTSSQCDILYLSQIWINNLFNLIQNDVQADLNSIVADLESSFLVVIYTKISQLFNRKMNSLQDKNHIVYLWAKFLLTEKMHEVVLKNKSIIINIQVILHQFIREILGQIPLIIDIQLNLIILSVYAKYYGQILKQKQCIQINNHIIKYIINKFPQILTQAMIIKEGISQKCIQMINLENYNAQFLKQLAKQCFNKNNMQISLDHLQKKVSKIILKYLIHENIVSLPTILNQTDILAYTIQNDIQLHLDIYQNVLENKMYDNIQFYLSLVSKGHSKNRYRRIVDRCCLNLLLNELQENSNRKLIKINENMVNLLVENLDFIVHIAAKHHISAFLLFNALFAFISRSLYYNIPLAVNYFLMIVLVQKYKVLGQQLLQKEANLVREIVKFCKMYQGTHRNYYLLGFAGLTMLLYGLPCLSHLYVIGLNIQQTLNENTIFLQSITQLLTGQSQIIDKVCHRQTKKLKNEERFQIGFKKCIFIGLIRHLAHVIKIGNNVSPQVIKQFNNLIDQLMMNEASKMDKNHQELPFDRNNRDLWTKIDDQQKKAIHRSQKEQNPVMKEIEQILTKFEQYDEFAQYKQLQRQIQSIYAEHNKQHERLLQSQRVHGKIRMIVHVNK